MALSSKSLAGPGYIILNVLRVLNIISLMTVIAASVIMLVKTFIVSKFFFFDACSHVITTITSIFLIVSETGLFPRYFSTHWPLLSPFHGFVTLGVFMLMIGINILGNLNKEATSIDSLGLPFWRVVIAGGILVLILAFFNIFASYFFRDRKRGITARNVRAHGCVAVPTPKPSMQPSMSSISRSNSSKAGSMAKPFGLTINTQPAPPHPANNDAASVSRYSRSFTSPKKPWMKSPAKAFSPTKTFKSMRSSILPSYYAGSPTSCTPAPGAYPHDQPSPPYQSDMQEVIPDKHEVINPPYPVKTEERAGNGNKRRGWSMLFGEKEKKSGDEEKQMNISGPLNVDTRFAHLVKPQMAHHPSRRGRDEEEGVAF